MVQFAIQKLQTSNYDLAVVIFLFEYSTRSAEHTVIYNQVTVHVHTLVSITVSVILLELATAADATIYLVVHIG